ncbi:MAG: DNA topology modulation protein FlaR [Clostridia bacterium]|nr:DNA topology modulation protein FlaR [Clostridia bacterium]
MKIQIMGHSGSGKSTLARQLGAMYNLPVLHLDSTFYYGDWQRRTRQEQTEIVQGFLQSNPTGWVVDGNYAHICPERFEQSDLTIFLDFNRIFCFFSAWKRAKNNKDKIREDLNCKDKFDWEFAKWILWESRLPKRRKNMLKLFNSTSGQKVMLKNRKQVVAFVQRLQQQLEEK